MTRLSRSFSFAALCLLLVRCSPAPLSAVEAPGLKVLALGDTLRLTASYHKVGTLDSIIMTVRDSQPGAPARILARRVVSLAGSFDTVTDVPTPPLASG